MTEAIIRRLFVSYAQCSVFKEQFVVHFVLLLCFVFVVRVNGDSNNISRWILICKPFLNLISVFLKMLFSLNI